MSNPRMSTAGRVLNALFNTHPQVQPGYIPTYPVAPVAAPVNAYGTQPYVAPPVYGPPAPMMQQPGFYSPQNSMYPPAPQQPGPYTQPCDFTPPTLGPGYFY